MMNSKLCDTVSSPEHASEFKSKNRQPTETERHGQKVKTRALECFSIEFNEMKAKQSKAMACTKM